MASNQRVLVKRIIEMAEHKEAIYGKDHRGRSRVVATRTVRRPVYRQGIFETSNSMSGRTLTMVVEGSRTDALQLLRSKRTPSGNVKGFTRVKGDKV